MSKAVAVEPTVTKREIVDAFHRLVFAEAREHGIAHTNTYWMGIHTVKFPHDLFTLQWLLWEYRPGLVIETGTYAGGSAMFMASIMDMYSNGHVITIDIQRNFKQWPTHPRVSYLSGGSSTDPETVKEVKTWVDYYGKDQHVMVVLDSDHTKEHVLGELEAYHQFVTPSCYLIVEDTDIAGHPVVDDYGYGEGPWPAVEEWLPKHPDFIKDERLATRYLFSANTWLRRMRT